jgi:Glu-tRNA(Gln) amidotransferase subunit E-like FAD-binding protein
MNAITKINSNNMTDKGEELIEKNEFFRDLSELMENEKFTKFFDKYFKNMTESKITLVYMKLYNEMKTRYKEINDEELDKRINVYLMWKIMSDRHLNKFTLHTILQNLESPKKNEILKEISQFMTLENYN